MGYLVKNQKGQAAIIVAIVGVFMLMGIAALAIDVGYLFATKNELQNTGDGASLAAARELGALYQGMSYDEQQGYVLTSAEEAAIRQRAKDVALQNYAGGKGNLIVEDADIIIGDWDVDASSLTPTTTQPNGVRVIARRDTTSNAPVSTFFATTFKIFGGNSDLVDVRADAIAALTGQNQAGDGDLPIPIGISRWWFDNNACLDTIAFSPSNDPQSCAGWTTFTYHPSNDPTIQDLLSEALTNPEVYGGDWVEFIGGDLSTNTFNEMMLAYQRNGYDAIPCQDLPCLPVPDGGTPTPLWELDDAGNQVLDKDGNPIRLYYPDSHIAGCSHKKYDDCTPRNYHEWETTVIVYESQDCANPNQSLQIAGFARVIINEVLGAPDKTVRGRVLCDFVDPGDTPGGGGDFGVLGSIPGLVE